jgi:hypothetical protein
MEWILKAREQADSRNKTGGIAGGEAIRARLQEHHGYLRLTAEDPSSMSLAKTAAVLVDLATELGEVMWQEGEESLVAVVEDTGKATTRGSKTSRELVYHTDIGPEIPDVVLLYTVRRAAEGGEFSIITAEQLYRSIRDDATLVTELGAAWLVDGSMVAPRPDTLLELPILSVDGPSPRVVYNRARIERGHRLSSRPLKPHRVAALDRLDEVLAGLEPHDSFISEPGELLVADNRAMLHTRSAFSGDGSLEHDRQLLRVWVNERIEAVR